MPFVKRNQDGEIEAISQQQDELFSEEISNDDKELQQFLSQIGQETFTQSDLDFVRVVEDLINLLIAKNYIRFTDLPDQAQGKMRSRQALRGKLNSSLDLLSDENTDGLL